VVSHISGEKLQSVLIEKFTLTISYLFFTLATVYDNNPASPKARARRAMVGCKNTSARSLAGESIGNTRLSEKECNQLIMNGESDFMLQALTKLDCPSCPFGIGER